MDREDNVTCLVQVCARLEATLPASTDGDVTYCHAVHHDIAAISAGQAISIIDVRCVLHEVPLQHNACTI
jgi:hypothetical protein